MVLHAGKATPRWRLSRTSRSFFGPQVGGLSRNSRIRSTFSRGVCLGLRIGLRFASRRPSRPNLLNLSRNLYPVLLEMPNSRQRSVIRSPSRCRLINFMRSSTGLLSFQGMGARSHTPKKCYPCLRSVLLPMYPVWTRPVPGTHHRRTLRETLFANADADASRAANFAPTRHIRAKPLFSQGVISPPISRWRGSIRYSP